MNMRVEKTDEWKKWKMLEATREYLFNSCASALPVMNPYPPYEWTVWHPKSDVYMIVDYDEHIEEHKRLVGDRYV
jgi:hypothetical protein